MPRPRACECNRKHCQICGHRLRQQRWLDKHPEKREMYAKREAARREAIANGAYRRGMTWTEMDEAALKWLQDRGYR